MKLSNKPQRCGPSDWYYEEPYYVTLIHQVHGPTGDLRQTDHIKIPWRMLITSVKRYKAEPQRKAKA